MTMQIIGKERLFSFSDNGVIGEKESLAVRTGKGCYVQDFVDLSSRVAHLSFMNPNYVMLFRGQKCDYRRIYTAEKDSAPTIPEVYITTLKPGLLRGNGDIESYELRRRFNTLESAELMLQSEYTNYSFPDADRLKKQRILRWSIIQHYEVCPTPLLDVTHSLRIAASFASDGAEDEAFVFVLGVPNLSGAITASAEAGLQIVRLSSVCPPSALRPHIQEGYLLGEYPEMSGYDQKEHYAHYEIDFGRRLVAKFRFNPQTFWKSSDFPRIDRAALYPNGNDPLHSVAEAIKQRLR